MDRAPIIRVPSGFPRSKEALKAVREDFLHAGRIPLFQDYPGGNPAAAPTGWVRLLCHGTALHLLAELDDGDIFTRATGFNQPLWQQGDCFEIFLKMAGREEYIEFHVAPNNAVLQLLYPSSAAFTRTRIEGLPLEDFLQRFTIKEPAFESRVWIEQERMRWNVLASIDLQIIGLAAANGAEEKLEFLFSRYDWTRNDTVPLLSASSRLDELNFHRQANWGILVLKREEHR